MWGWDQFVGEVESFLRAAHRGFAGCSLQFAEYVVDRFGLVLQVLSSILTPLEDQEEEDVTAVL